MITPGPSPLCQQIACAVLSALMAAGCLASALSLAAASARAQTPLAARGAPPDVPNSKGQTFATIVVPATIHAFFVADLYAKDTGYISKVNADIGDYVKKGQVLAVIDDPELQAQFDKAEAAVQQAKAALEVAKRRIAAMQADLALGQATLRRQQALFVGKAATAQSLDEAQTKEGVSKANLEMAKAKITLEEANLQAAMAETERLQALLQYDNIHAPFDGVVTRRLVNPGDLVQSAASSGSRPLFTCQALDLVRVLADVPEADAGNVRPGLLAEVRLYGEKGAALRGTVSRVAKALDPATRTMRIEIDVPNPQEKLLPGMYAQVTLGPDPQPLNLPKR
jgi:multidrug efflux pump subunit AcrA (membrane-fusion protein)